MDRRHINALRAAGIGSAATLHWVRTRSLAKGFAAPAAALLYTSQNGLLEVDLTAALSPVQVGDRSQFQRHLNASVICVVVAYSWQSATQT